MKNPVWFTEISELIEHFNDLMDKDYDRLYVEIDCDSACLQRECPDTDEGDCLVEKIENMRDYFIDRLKDECYMDISDLTYEQTRDWLPEALDRTEIALYEIKRDWRYEYQNLLERVDLLKQSL